MPDDPRLIDDPQRPGAVSLRVGDADQSYVVPGDPLHLEFDYMRRMAEVIGVWSPPPGRLRVTHVGGGALTMPRFIAASRPTSSQIVFEPDERVNALVREHIPLERRSGIRVRPVGGREGLASLAEASADLIIVDAFRGGRVPGELATAEAAHAYHRVLGPDGLAVMNVVDAAPFAWTRGVASAFLATDRRLTVGAAPGTWRGRGPGNLILVAGTVDARLLGRPSAGPFPYRWRTDREARDWVGGVSPFDDVMPVDSPARSAAGCWLKA